MQNSERNNVKVASAMAGVALVLGLSIAFAPAQERAIAALTPEPTTAAAAPQTLDSAARDTSLESRLSGPSPAPLCESRRTPEGRTETEAPKTRARRLAMLMAGRAVDPPATPDETRTVDRLQRARRATY